MSGTVSIGCYATHPELPDRDCAVVAIDVIRASTTVTTALYLGREVYLASTADDAFLLGKGLDAPLYVGELGGHVPYGFDLTNSPVQIMALANTPAGFFTHARRPLILVSSSGVPLVLGAAAHEAAYMSCLRNFTAVANHIGGRHEKIRIIGAGTRGEFRREDQIGCAWLAERLVEGGYRPENAETEGFISKWSGVDVEAIREGNSAEYLRRSGQLHDLEFVLHHVDDLSVVPTLLNRRLEDAQHLR